MTLLSISTMRLKRPRIILLVSVLAVMLLTLSVDSEDSDCEPAIAVHRKTVYKTITGASLEMMCPFTLCNPRSSVTWQKFNNTGAAISITGHSCITTKWKNGSNLTGTSALIFQNIQRSSEGMYRCEVGSVVSHLIQVIVADVDPLGNDTFKNITNKTPQESNTALWMYVYTAAAIGGFVILVIILSIISMRGCKGKPKGKKEEENQYMAIPMPEQPLQAACLPPSPRRAPPVPTSRHSVRQKKPPGEPPREPRIVYGRVKRGNERLTDAVEEKQSSIVYAALNHQMTPIASTPPQRPKEESSEYAAIRIS